MTGVGVSNDDNISRNINNNENVIARFIRAISINYILMKVLCETPFCFVPLCETTLFVK